MITLRLSSDEFDVKKALVVKKWSEYFDGTVERDEDQYDSVYYNDRLVEFKFVQVDGAKSVRRGNYVLVMLQCPEDHGEEDSPEDDFYIIRFNNLTNPAEYGGGNSVRDLEFYLKSQSSATFKRADYDEWVKDERLKVLVPEVASEPYKPF